MQDCEVKAIVASSTAIGNGLLYAINMPIFDNITTDSSFDRASVCEAESKDIRGFTLHDFGQGPGGFLVHDTSPDSTGAAFLPTNYPCQMIVDSCLKSCPNTCFRLLKMIVPGSSIHAGKQMLVTGANGVSRSFNGFIRYENEDQANRRVYPVFLPSSGGPYNITFVVGQVLHPLL